MKLYKTALLAASVLAFPACSQAGQVNTQDKEAIEKIVYEYLMENPEVVQEALIELEAKQDRESLASVKSSIYNEPRDVVLGPADAKVTIVEFFDYNCSYCKRTTDWLVETMEKHPKDVRVIFKELPILDRQTKTSRNAAKAALAAHRQGKYLEMHTALMEARGLNDDRIEEIAKDIGLNVARLKGDMQDPEIAAYIEDTLIMGQKLRPLTGTPFFMIGDEYIAGANVNRLNDMLANAMRG